MLTRMAFVTAALVAAARLSSSPCLAVERELVVSVYQGPCSDGDLAANLATVRRVIDEAGECGSHFLAFPETFLSGYDTPEHVRQAARTVDDPEIKELVAATAGHEMVVLVGMARRHGNTLFSSVIVVQSGKLLGVYDKTMLTGSDRDVLGFSPGQSVPVFEAHGVRFAAVICHDTSFPFPAMAARLDGAQLLFTPHYNYIAADKVDDHRLWVRNCHVGLACQLKMVVARSNVVVTNRAGQVGYGDSFILGPNGRALAESRLFRTELVTARVTPEMLKGATAWADLKETPDWLKAKVAEQLVP